MHEDLVVIVDLMNERGDVWRMNGVGATVDVVIDQVERAANLAIQEESNVWVMNDWRAA